MVGTCFSGWCLSKTFDTLILYDSKKCIQGLVTVQKKQIFIPESGCTAEITYIPYHIGQMSTDLPTKQTSIAFQLLKATVLYSKVVGADMMFIFENGLFTKNVIEENKAVPTGEMYIDFYNFSNGLHAKDIFVPLL